MLDQESVKINENEKRELLLGTKSNGIVENRKSKEMWSCF